MLHRAARVGDHDTIRSLASAGADLNEIFDIGLDPGARPTPATPLMVAAGSGDGASVETVLLLLRLGADAGARDNQERTALWYADVAQMIDLLLSQGLSLEDRDEYDWTPLDDAVGDGPQALRRLEALIEAGADVNATHDHGWTIFMSAASCPQRDRAVLERLVQAGADPHAVTEHGYNAIRAAIDVDFEANAGDSVRSVLTYLKELGVDIEHRNNADHTPLARAIWWGTDVEVQVLAELGADVDATGPAQACCHSACDWEELPLILAAISAATRQDAELEALIAAGIRLDLVNGEGLSPLEHAQTRLADLEIEDDHSEWARQRLDAARTCVSILQAVAQEPS